MKSTAVRGIHDLGRHGNLDWGITFAENNGEFTSCVSISEIGVRTKAAETIAKTALLIEKVADVDITASDRNLLLRCRLW